MDGPLVTRGFQTELAQDSKPSKNIGSRIVTRVRSLPLSSGLTDKRNPSRVGIEEQTIDREVGYTR
jgi:hypothetical protein